MLSFRFYPLTIVTRDCAATVQLLVGYCSAVVIYYIYLPNKTKRLLQNIGTVTLEQRHVTILAGDAESRRLMN